jgi:hypothetical protein
MGRRPRTFAWLTVLLGSLTALTGMAHARQTGEVRAETPPTKASQDITRSAAAPLGIPLNDIPAGLRDKVRAVVEQPTLVTHGTPEAFACQPVVYHWLLDHPDQTVRLWRMLGAKVTDIQKVDENVFCYQDAQGTKVSWGVALDDGHQRVWYAEGKVKPGLLLPVAQVQAVLVLTYCEGKDGKGNLAVRHQMDLFIKTDSAAIALATRLLGASGPRMAETYVGQIQMFFAAMSWYLDQHPDRAESMFQELQRSEKPAPKGKN